LNPEIVEDTLYCLVSICSSKEEGVILQMLDKQLLDIFHNLFYAHKE